MHPTASSIAGLIPRVHIIGLGSIGTFAAHSISQIPSGPTVSLLLHRKSLLQEYTSAGSQIRFEATDGVKTASKGYEIETYSDGQWYNSLLPNEKTWKVNKEPIRNLVVCVKTIQTVSAIRTLANRLDQDSNILFLQNGAGMIEAINDQAFPDPQSRPKIRYWRNLSWRDTQ